MPSWTAKLLFCKFLLFFYVLNLQFKPPSQMPGPMIPIFALMALIAALLSSKDNHLACLSTVHQFELALIIFYSFPHTNQSKPFLVPPAPHFATITANNLTFFVKDFLPYLQTHFTAISTFISLCFVSKSDTGTDLFTVMLPDCSLDFNPFFFPPRVKSIRNIASWDLLLSYRISQVSGLLQNK